MAFRTKEEQREYYRRYREANRDKYKLYNEEYYRTHRAERIAKTRKWKTENPEAEKQRGKRRTEAGYWRGSAWLKRKYGVTEEAFKAKMIQQNYKCAVCQCDFKKIPCVDHNHTTGQIRGLLCNSCNAALGFVKESPRILFNIVDYIELWDLVT